MDLNRIEAITLNSSKIGQNVNERLTKIDANFTNIKTAIEEIGLFTPNIVSRDNLDNSLRTLINDKLVEHGFSIDKTYTLTIFSNTSGSIKYFNTTGIPFEILGLNNIVQYLTISGEYSNNSWRISVHNTPVIYYDSTSQSYCWQLGDTRTGISARGFKGDDGTNAVAESVRTVTVDSAPTSTNNPTISGYYNNSGVLVSGSAGLSSGTPVWYNYNNKCYTGVAQGGEVVGSVEFIAINSMTQADINTAWTQALTQTT